MDQTQALAAAVRQHEDRIKAAKRRYSECVAQLGKAPTDVALLTETAQISNQLASAAAGLDALNQALDAAREADEKRAVEQRKSAGRKRAALVQERVKARRASYERLQLAADSFLAALRDHVDGGAALRADANGVAGDLFGTRADEHVVTAADAAAGTAGIDALALHTVLRDAYMVFGAQGKQVRERLDRYIGVDTFAHGVTFGDAYAANAKVIARLGAA